MFVEDFDLSWVWPLLYRAKPKRDLAKKLSSIVMYGVWYVLLQRSVVSCTGDLLVETFLKSENKSKSYLEVRIILANNDPPSQYLGGRGWQYRSGHLSCYFDRRQMPHLYGYLLATLAPVFVY